MGCIEFSTNYVELHWLEPECVLRKLTSEFVTGSNQDFQFANAANRPVSEKFGSVVYSNCLLEFGFVDSLPETIEVFFAAAEALDAQPLVQRLPHPTVLVLDQFQLAFKNVTTKKFSVNSPGNMFKKKPTVNRTSCWARRFGVGGTTSWFACAENFLRLVLPLFCKITITHFSKSALGT